MSPKQMLQECETLMLDMDGTLLDLAYDNYMWLEVVPAAYATRHELPEGLAREQLYAHMNALRGQLDWYCLDHWSERFDLDIADLHRSENHRIGYLPGAEQFLQQVASSNMRVLLVTNSHRTTLDIKHEVTGVADFFDAIYTSHDVGQPKEDQAFWQDLMRQENFDPARTVFVDDNLHVLESAGLFGLANLVAVAQPDTREPARSIDSYQSVERVSQMVSADA